MFVKGFLKLASLILISLLMIIAAGCTSKQEVKNTPTEDSGFPVKVKDISGAEIVIEEKPKRIVSLTPSNTEILFALGLDQEIVGVTEWCDYPAEAKNKEKIGDINTNAEKVVSLKPDLVVASSSLNSEVIQSLRDLGLKVIEVEPQTVEEVFETVRTLAKVTATEDKAEDIVSGMKSTLEELEQKINQISDKDKLKVFIEVGYDPLYTAGKNSYVDNLVSLAGGKNVASELEFYNQYSLEQLLADNPDVILATDYYYLTDQQKVPNRKGWENINAVKTGRVIGDIDANLLSRPGPRSAQAVEEVAKNFYPELFK